MSVLITFKPTNPVAGSLTNGTSLTVEALRKVFGDPPIVLNNSHVTQLQAMAAAVERLNPNPYEQLLDAILEYDEIQVEFLY